MKKRFLGIVCILYSLIIIYVWLFDKLKNYLALSMQMYLKVSLIPMLIIGLVLLFGKKDNHKFKLTDLVLLIPIIALILANDGRLTTSLVKNRMSTFTNEEKRQSKKEIVNKEEKEKKEEYDLSNLSNNETMSPQKIHSSITLLLQNHLTNCLARQIWMSFAENEHPKASTNLLFHL